MNRQGNPLRRKLSANESESDRIVGNKLSESGDKRSEVDNACVMIELRACPTLMLLRRLMQGIVSMSSCFLLHSSLI